MKWREKAAAPKLGEISTTDDSDFPDEEERDYVSSMQISTTALPSLQSVTVNPCFR